MSRGQAGWKSRARNFADLLASNGMVKSDKVDMALPSYHSSSDFTSGTLVTTNIPASATSGASFVIETTGKSYSGSQPPFSFIAQGYLYNNTIINYSGSNITGSSLTYIKAMNNGGYLSFWWPRISYWNSFNVHVRDAGGSANNRVTSIGNSVDPSAATKKVQIDLESGSGGGLLKTHYWQDSTHRSFGQGGIYVLSNTFSQEGTNSKFIIDCGIVVGATDNVSGHIQLYYNGSWHTTSFRGTGAQQDYNNSSWGDLALRHESGMPLKQHAKFVWQPNVTGTLGVRMYIQAENGTRLINRRNSWGSSPNDITGFSSITVQESKV